MHCPLCKSRKPYPFHESKDRAFLRCRDCDLVFVDSQFHLPKEEEIRRYGLHENDPDDRRYLDHLSRLTSPLLAYLKPGACGMDFGCGPGPSISGLLGKIGFSVSNYDPIFANEPRLLDESYDFLTCTETVEHFNLPHESWNLIVSLITNGGILGVMTQFTDFDNFEKWPYARDATHISFYSPQTFEWIASNWNLKIEHISDPIVIFRK